MIAHVALSRRPSLCPQLIHIRISYCQTYVTATIMKHARQAALLQCIRAVLAHQHRINNETQ